MGYGANIDRVLNQVLYEQYKRSGGLKARLFLEKRS